MAPQSRAIPVLITRPEPQASRFAALLRESFGDRVAVVLTPLMSTVFPAVSLPAGPFDAVILTSEAGAMAAGALREKANALPDLAFCVGERTAKAASDAGFRAVSAKGDAEALVCLIAGQGQKMRLLHLRGQETRGDVVARLRAKGFSAEEAVVYAQMPTGLTSEALACLATDQTVAVPLLSPRSAALFRQAIAGKEIRARLVLLAFSAAIAAEAEALPHVQIVISDEPNLAALVRRMSQALFPT